VLVAYLTNNNGLASDVALHVASFILSVATAAHLPGQRSITQMIAAQLGGTEDHSIEAMRLFEKWLHSGQPNECLMKRLPDTQHVNIHLKAQSRACP
jgi:hypothetical protein